MMAARRRLETTDDGFTLIEVLMAVAIMSVCMVGVLSAMGTATKGAAVHRREADGQAVLVSAVEKILRSNTAYDTSCSTALPSYATALAAVPLPPEWSDQGWTAAQAFSIPASSVKWWNGTAFTTTCNDNQSTDAAGLLHMQQFTVQVTSPGASDVEAVTVVKRDDS